MKRIIVIMVVGLLIGGGYYGNMLYSRMYGKNVQLKEDKTFIYIPTGSDLDDLTGMLMSESILEDTATFRWVAEKKNLRGKNIVPGKYEIVNGWSNNELINHLRAGNGRLEVEVTFNNVRTLEQIAGKVSKYIEADSVSIIDVLQNKDTIARYGFNRNNFISLFIPNTYKMDWATDAGEFLSVIASNYRNFWTEERKSKAKALGLSQSEVSTLASIVQAEQTRHASERPRIAGLYLNRLKKGIRLQSDPTVVYAVGDFNLRRVLNKHLEVASPYNTYLNAGLPPGPIQVPDISSIDAVLNYEKNDYIYMCAKPGYEGYHNFSKTLDQHEQYAREYRKWLDKEGIK